jgi:hypothetical protein
VPALVPAPHARLQTPIMTSSYTQVELSPL